MTVADNMDQPKQMVSYTICIFRLLQHATRLSGMRFSRKGFRFSGPCLTLFQTLISVNAKSVGEGLSRTSKLNS